MFLEQNQTLVSASVALEEMLTNFAGCETQCQQISRLEARGDILNHEIRKHLATTFITPIDRDDIHEINSSQEAVLNHIEAVSNRIGVYEVKRIRFPAQKIISNVVPMVKGIGQMLVVMQDGKDGTDIVKGNKAHKKECEMLLLTGLGELYDDQVEVLDIIKWTQIYDRMDKLYNKAWQLIKYIEGVMLKNA